MLISRTFSISISLDSISNKITISYDMFGQGSHLHLYPLRSCRIRITHSRLQSLFCITNCPSFSFHGLEKAIFDNMHKAVDCYRNQCCETKYVALYPGKSQNFLTLG